RNQKRKAAADSDEEGDHVDKKIKTLKAKVTNSSGTAQIRQPPVDRACTLPATYSVYVDSEVAWNARLNQTNIGANNNKFYFIQLLRSTNQYAVFCHWGRVGSNGQSSTDMFFDLESAKREFDRKFRGKTKNSWSGRDNFVKHPVTMPPKRAIKAIPSTPIFADCVFSIAGSFPGQTHGDINALLVTANAGAQVTSTVTKKTTHLITNQEEIDKKTSKVTKAASMDNITLVSLDWITESLDKKKKLDIAPYTLGSAAATSTSSSTNGTTANTDSKTDVDMKAVDSKASKDG
ncbi:Poly [ADP-ribose] polymerase 3, partial [Lobosporangium transversale]